MTMPSTRAPDEIGIEMALGAERKAIVAMSVARDSSRLIGVVIGVGGGSGRMKVLRYVFARRHQPNGRDDLIAVSVPSS